jgi:hypothetical protein
MSSYHSRSTTLYRRIEEAPMRRAAARARLFHHHVAWIGGRQFKVNGSAGGHYVVTFVDAADRKLARCECAGFEVAICRHIAAAYVLDFAIRAAVRTRPAVKVPGNIERRADGRVYCDGWQI